MMDTSSLQCLIRVTTEMICTARFLLSNIFNSMLPMNGEFPIFEWAITQFVSCLKTGYTVVVWLQFFSFKVSRRGPLLLAQIWPPLWVGIPALLLSVSPPFFPAGSWHRWRALGQEWCWWWASPEQQALKSAGCSQPRLRAMVRLAVHASCCSLEHLTGVVDLDASQCSEMVHSEVIKNERSQLVSLLCVQCTAYSSGVQSHARILKML